MTTRVDAYFAAIAKHAGGRSRGAMDTDSNDGSIRACAGFVKCNSAVYKVGL